MDVVGVGVRLGCVEFPEDMETNYDCIMAEEVGYVEDILSMPKVFKMGNYYRGYWRVAPYRAATAHTTATIGTSVRTQVSQSCTRLFIGRPEEPTLANSLE